MTDPWFHTEGLDLYLGDAATTLDGLDAGSVDCIVTSPPYFAKRDYGTDGQLGLERTVSDYVADILRVMSAARRVLNPSGTLWLNLGDTYRGKSLTGVPWRIAIAMIDDGWLLRNEVVWRKRNAMPTSAHDRLANRHETVFLFTKSEHYYFDADAIGVEPTEQSESALSFDRGSKEALAPGQWSVQHRPRADRAPRALSNPGDVWDIANRPFKGAHFATFPPDLPARCIACGCPKDGTALDPFSGSGTTGAAALALGRNYIGVDINERYLELSLRTRLREVQGVLLQ